MMMVTMCRMCCSCWQAPRTHRIPPTPDGKPVPVGFTIMKVLGTYCNECPDINVVWGAQVKELLVRDAQDGREKQVYGCIYTVASEPEEPIELLADALILTTGGFAFDRG